MTRFEKKEELIGLFSSGSILIGDMLDEAMDFAEKNIEKEATRKIVECSEFLAKLPHWISVEDEMPKNRELVFITDCESADMGFYDYIVDAWQPFEKWLGNITHWMPLPQAPMKGDQGND